MGLNFKFIVIWKAFSTMSSGPSVPIRTGALRPFGSAGTKAASAPAPSAAHPAASTSYRGNRGKGGAATLTPEEHAAKKAEAEARATEARARALRAQADAAEAEARLRAAQSTAVVASTPRAKPGATTGGGDFVTRDEFNTFRGQVQDGFSTVIQQNQRTHDVLAGFLQMMNGGGLPAPKAPVSRQIGNGAQEVVEPLQISYGQNAGWDSAAEGSGRFAQSSSQLSQSVVACGGGAAQSFYREPVPTATSRTLTPKFDAAAARWNAKRTPNNERILQAIRDATTDDNMRCLLLALVNGKTLSEITNMYNEDVASLLSIRNTSFFQNFFAALSRCGLPSNFDVKVDASKTKTSHGFVMTYQQLSQAPSNVDKLVRILRGE